MTRTTRRRLAILATIGVLTVGTAGGVFYARNRAADRRLALARTQGLAMFEQGKYADALFELSKYIGRNQADRQALFAYGKSRVLTEEPDGRHITEGIGILRRYMELAPDDLEARQLLLDLYTRAGYGNEAIQLADKVLLTNPKDIAALKARYIALGRNRRIEEALTTARQYLDIKPDDLSAHWDTLDLLYASGAPASAALSHATTFAKRIGESDPRSQLLMAHAATYANDRSTAEAQVRSATDAALATVGGTPAPAAPSTQPSAEPFTLTADFVTRAADIFDRLSLFAEGQRFVEKAADSHASDPNLARALAIRLWSSGRLDAVLRRTDKLDPNDRGAATPLLAMRALSLLQQGKKDEARPIVDALAGRDSDSLATGWALALRAAFLNPKATPLERQKDYQAAISRAMPRHDDAAVAIFRHLLAGVSRDLGETELAIAHWQQCIQLLPEWPAPYQLMAQALLDTNRPAEAFSLAQMAFKRAPTVENLIVLGDSWSRLLSVSPDAASAQKLVDQLQAARKEVPDEARLLPPLAAAMAAAGHRDQAVSLVRSALAAPNTPPAVLAKLADLASSPALGLEVEANAAFSRLGATPDTPDRALAHALRAASTGQPSDALAGLKKLAGATPNLAWQVAICRFLDETNDPDAMSSYKDLITKNPEALEAHLAMISSRAAWGASTDRTLLANSIDRVRALAGENGITWRIAKARLLLQAKTASNGTVGAGEASDRDAAEAVVLLSDVVRIAPRLIPPRLLLAKALRSVNNGAGSLDQVSAAAELDPQSPGIALELVTMLEQQGKLAEAKSAATKIARSPRLTLGQRVRFAAVLARLGDSQTAIELLSRAPQDSPREADRAAEADLLARDATLARLLARQPDRLKDATTLFDKLLSRPKPDLAVATDAAEFFARQGDLPKARVTLDHALEGSPSDIADSARATLEERFGDSERALALLKNVVATKPSPAAHTQLSGFLLRSGRYDEAAKAIADGLASAPADSALNALARARDALSAMKNRRDLQLLIALVSRDPTQPAVPDTLDALRLGGYTVSDASTIAALRQVIDKYPTFLPAHALIIQSYLDAKRPRDAADAAARCFASLPTDPDAARLTAAAYLASGDPQATLGVARRWRELTPDDALPADLAVASAAIALRDPEGAIRQLQPYINAGRTSAQLSLLTTRALLAAGRTDEAWNNASELWRKTPSLRPALVAALTEGPSSQAGGSALSLLDRFSLELAGSDADRFLLAQACYQLGAKYNSDAALTRAENMLQAFEQKSAKLPSSARILWGEILRRKGDTTGAEKQYRQALATDSESAIASNNLADLLLRRDGAAGAREASDLARKAVSKQPQIPEFHETLARASAALGQTDAALASFETSLKLGPDRLDTLIPYASLLSTAGRTKDATEVLRRIESLLPGAPALPPDIQKQLEDTRGSLRRVAATP